MCQEYTTNQPSIGINHVSVNENYTCNSDFNIDNVESNVEHDQAFINIKLGLKHKDVNLKIDKGSRSIFSR